MNEEEVKEEVKNKNNSKLIIIILAILVLLLIGVLVYVLFLRKQEKPVNNNSQQNTNETVKLDVDKASKELIDLISDFGGVMPLKAKGDKPSSYTINDLTKEINSDIILSYALQNISEKDNNICKYDDKYNSVCHIKVSELNTKLGLNIDDNIKTTNYVLGVVKKDNDDYYKVIFPATEWSQEYYVRDCTTTHTDETLTIKCDVYEVIEMYDPYEEAKVGIGEFIYNIKDKLAFEKFVFKASSTSNTKKDDNKNTQTTAKEYKTSDGKYTLKISADGKKAYLNNREIIESTNRVESSRYLQIWGEFKESFNYIADLTFVIDKERKLIVDPTTVKAIAQEDKDGLGEYARFSSRPGFMFINVNGHDLFAFEYEIGADIYTTNWKKIGYIFSSAKEIKYDNVGIYICGDEDETRELDDLKCHNEIKYDFNGNKIG